MMQIPGLRMRRAYALVRAGLGDSASDLATFHATVTTGDMYLVAQEWDSAVQTYQAAGSMGVTTVGPEIDSKTGGASKTLTSSAWNTNGSLAAITTPATQQTALTAQGFAQKMGALYDQAISIPPPLPPPPPPPTQPTSSPAPTMTLAPTTPPAGAAGKNYTLPILVSASVLGVGIVGWAAYRRWGARRKR